MYPSPNNQCWLLSPEAVSTVLGEGAVILDLRTKFFFSANSTAWAIAQMFEMGATRSEVHQASKHWGASSNDTSAIDATIDLMIAEKLIEPMNSAPQVVAQVAVSMWTVPTLDKHREPLQRIMVSAFDPGLPLAE